MNSKYVSYFRFLKVATHCFVDSTANPWPSLTELHDVVTWNGFHFTDVPCQGAFVEFLALLIGLGQSAVLCRSQVGTQLTADYLTIARIHFMARTNQLSKEKRQSIITLRTESQSVRKIAKTLNVSPSPVSKSSRKKHQALRRNWLTWGPPQERKTKSHLCCWG